MNPFTWPPCNPPQPSPVTSVFGRVGAIVATLGDYAASLITNNSTVSGATVKDALDNLVNGTGVFTAIKIAQGTIVALATGLSHTVTWNNAAVNFAAIVLNVTNTASGAASKLIDLQVNGISGFSVTRGSQASLGNGTTGGGLAIDAGSANSQAITITRGKTLIVDTTVSASNVFAGAALIVVGPSLTAALAFSAQTIAQTWNTTGSPTALLMTITNTASGAASKLMDLLVGANSMFAVAKAGGVLAAGGTAIPAGGTAGVGYQLFSTANFGVFAGSGAPTLSAAKGSLYLRSDGTGTTDRAYINTDGATTWTAITTVA